MRSTTPAGGTLTVTQGVTSAAIPVASPTVPAGACDTFTATIASLSTGARTSMVTFFSNGFLSRRLMKLF